MNVGIGTMIGNPASVDNGQRWSYKDSPVQATNHKHESQYHLLSIPIVSSPCGGYRLTSKKETKGALPAFIPSNTFGRRKEGYKFGTSEKGTGYYIDHPMRLT